MQKEAALKRKYGITEADWQKMFMQQNGRCAICRCQQRYQRLAVDHDHKTGQVRGLLCVQCNRGLGRFFDSPLRLRRAAEYLEAARQPKAGVNADPSTAGAATPLQTPAQLYEMAEVAA